MDHKEFEQKAGELLQEELKTSEKLCYMSFVDPDGLPGKRFAGGIFTMAHGITHAIQKTHALNINPGGEVMYVECPNTFELDSKYMDRLLSKEEVESIG
jgi:hypothetical protein